MDVLKSIKFEIEDKRRKKGYIHYMLKTTIHTDITHFTHLCIKCI